MTGVPRRGSGLIIGLSVAALVLASLGIGIWSRSRRVAKTSAFRTALLGEIERERRALEADLPQVLDEENAARLYDQALAVYVVPPFHPVFKLDADWEAPKSALVSWVDQNEDAIRILETAAAMDRCRFPIATADLPGPGWSGRWYLGRNTQQSVRWSLSFLLLSRGRIALHEGRLDRAAHDALIVTRVQRHAHSFLPEPAGVSGLERCCDLLERVLRHPSLDAPLARRVARELIDWRVLCEADQFRTRLEVLLLEGELLMVTEPAGMKDVELRERLGLSQPPLLRWNLSSDDLAALRLQWEGLKARRQQVRLAGAAWRQPAEWPTKLAVLRAAFAVRAFQLERGTVPSGLEALVPEYLPEVPGDPYAEGALQFVKDEKTWSVWSAGRVCGPSGEGRPELPHIRADFPGR